jgi:hypothetical protein
MGTKIVKPEVQIVPLVDQKSLSLALSELQDELLVVPELRAKAAALKVTNAVEFAEAGALRADVRSHRKIPRFKLQPFQEVAKRVVDFLRSKSSEAEQQFEMIESDITAKMDAHARQERLAAEAEQRRINEERRVAAEKQAEADRKAREKEIEAQRKAGEVGKREAEKLKAQAAEEAKQVAANVEEAKVLPNLPTVAGSRRRLVYCFEVTDASAVKREWLMPDEQEIGRKVRDDKDPAKSMGEIGGIRVWTEDRT